MSKDPSPFINYLLALIVALIAILTMLFLPDSSVSQINDSTINLQSTLNIKNPGEIQGDSTQPQNSLKIKPNQLDQLPLSQ